MLESTVACFSSPRPRLAPVIAEFPTAMPPPPTAPAMPAPRTSRRFSWDMIWKSGSEKSRFISEEISWRASSVNSDGAVLATWASMPLPIFRTLPSAPGFKRADRAAFNTSFAASLAPLPRMLSSTLLSTPPRRSIKPEAKPVATARVPLASSKARSLAVSGSRPSCRNF